jgi:hypothetical protein
MTSPALPPRHPYNGDEDDCYDTNNYHSTSNQYFYGNSAFDSDSHDSGDVSVVTADPDHSHHLLFTYEVRFKTCTEPFLFHEKLLIGEMVTVQCERGYNIGFVTAEVFPDPDHVPEKRILAKLIDEDNTIKEMLQFKITAEKNALVQCRLHCKGHRLGSFADAIAAEFQFDRKKLTVYLKKYEDVSVCRLVRKLYDTYKMRIKVLEVDDPEAMKEMTKKYLDLSKLSVPLSDAYNFDPATSVLALKTNGRHKSDKHHSLPNYSKSHIGQSQHLIPSLVQYGPQADKRHNNAQHQQQHSLYQHHYYTPSAMHLGQPQRSDHRSNYAYPNYHVPAAATATSFYGQHTAGVGGINQLHDHFSHSSGSSHHHQPASTALLSFPQQRQSQFDRFSYASSNQPLEPFGHDGSFSGEVPRFQQSNLFPAFPTHNSSFYKDSAFASGPALQEDSLFPTSFSSMGGYPDSLPGPSRVDDSISNDLEALSLLSALSRPDMMDKRDSNSSISSNLSSPTNSVTSHSASSSLFLYPETHF